MIAVSISNVRSAEVSGATGDHWVTIRFGNNDRVTLHVRSKAQADAIATALSDLAPAFEAAR